MTEPLGDLRRAEYGDASAIAALHAESWRLHYRGSFSDAYLDGPIEAERLAFWRQRLDHPRSGQVTILAEAGTGLAGFVCVFLDHDRNFGSLIDNLHVAAGLKGQGIGRALVAAAGEAMLHSVPHRPAYLYVLGTNHAARGFYERIGGRLADSARKMEPDGSEHLVLRFVWDSAAALIDGVAGRP